MNTDRKSVPVVWPSAERQRLVDEWKAKPSASRDVRELKERTAGKALDMLKI